MRDGVREGESNYELNETTDCSCNLRPPQVLAHQDQRPYARRRISLEGECKDSEDKHLGTIVGPEHPHNMAWGDENGKTVYLCAKIGLYRIRFNILGVRALESASKSTGHLFVGWGWEL